MKLSPASAPSSRAIARPARMPTTQERYREFTQLASDADWAGNHDLAQRYRTIALDYRTRYLNGDLHDPPF